MVIHELSPAEAREALADEERRMDVVDLRTVAAYAAGHIAGARLVDPSRLAADPLQVPRDREVLLYDDGSASTAVRAAAFVTALGWGDAYVLAGGFAAWAHQGLPVERRA